VSAFAARETRERNKKRRKNKRRRKSGMVRRERFASADSSGKPCVLVHLQKGSADVAACTRAPAYTHAGRPTGRQRRAPPQTPGRQRRAPPQTPQLVLRNRLPFDERRTHPPPHAPSAARTLRRTPCTQNATTAKPEKATPGRVAPLAPIRRARATLAAGLVVPGLQPPRALLPAPRSLPNRQSYAVCMGQYVEVFRRAVDLRSES